MIPTRPRMQQHVPGLGCPICGQLIPVSIKQLLFDKSLKCPCCGLVLSIDKNKSDKALKILAKVDEAQQRVEDTSNFSR